MMLILFCGYTVRAEISPALLFGGVALGVVFGCKTFSVFRPFPESRRISV